MPFTPPFQRCYPPGDIVYRLSEVRELYWGKYESFCYSETLIYISTIDQYPATEKEKKGLWMRPYKADNFIQVLEQHKKYKSVCSNISYVLYGCKIESSPDDKRRRCKAGLNWAQRRSGRFSIHFLLDDININEVVSKSNNADKKYEPLVDKYKYRAYTGVELRWVYRNRNEQGVRESIQFWYQGEPCGFPWEADFDRICGKAVSHLWSDYKPRSVV